MNTTPGSGLRRVYVQVPASPYPTPRQMANSGDATPLKRKLSESHITVSSSPIIIKKQKFNGPLSAQPTNSSSDVNPPMPDEFLRCHHCSRKFNPASSIRCTTVNTMKTGKEVACRAKYCSACLKRHYHEDFMRMKSSIGKKRYKCPRCRNVCRCRRCQKGSQSTEDAPVSADKRQRMKENVMSPSTKKSTVEVYISTTPAKILSTKTSSSGIAKSVPKQIKQQKLLTLPPTLKWIPVPTNLDLDGAKARFQIREFVLRFTSIMDPTIPITQLAELEDVGCYQNEEEDMSPWVSSACVRSIILGVLGILTEKGDGIIKKPIQAAISSIRLTGTNLSKIWSILAKMRIAIGSTSKSTEDSSQAESVLSFPDPLPPPASDLWYTTRATRSVRDSDDPSSLLTIGHPAQMIPVVESLVVAALETPALRQEIENGVKEGKDVNRQVKECIKMEKERWDAEKKDKPKKSPEHEAHKRHIENLDNALKLVLPGFAPRFVPLGSDSGGRSYWALSPGAYERKAALNFISSTSGSKGVKKVRQRGHITTDVDDHSITKEWSWFVAVWGKKIPTGSKHKEREGKSKKNAITIDDDTEQEEVERWWGFYTPQEIKNVEKWIKIDAGVEPYGDTQLNSDKPVVSLVKGLGEYANMLEWRMKADKY